jgi:hypothetical protein
VCTAKTPSSPPRRPNAIAAIGPVQISEQKKEKKKDDLFFVLREKTPSTPTFEGNRGDEDAVVVYAHVPVLETDEQRFEIAWHEMERMHARDVCRHDRRPQSLALLSKVFIQKLIFF